MSMDDEQLKKLVLKFTKTLFEGRISEAEKMLASFKKKVKTEEEKRIYLALYGLFFSYTSEDTDSLLFKIYTDNDVSSQAQRIFKVIKEVSVPVLDERDPYLDVWTIILNNIDKIPVPHKLRQQLPSNSTT
ncbi:MAG: hypothetical protein QXI52_02850 [Nitrososphaerota archaeon]